ncbi:deubiquitinase OTUD6B [Microplitis mediator]|uniref:deubiquitinase OTUD6B n=1 Tax=Microplitis mediator TaxID=375433 RepID=UPI00255797B8|nr:deubiquitinase OTUD6B [Microplitis mediator]
MSDNDSEDFLLQKHKKERKELQAQIQVLKKSVCKGDKKKKRETTERIAQLESDLDRRHDEELNNYKLSQITLTGLPTKETIILPTDDDTNVNDNDNDDNKAETNPQKISKAQKRRDKKALAERERNQRIIEAEALNVFGKRNLEIQTIKKILVERDLMIYEIPSDGHCLYNAVSHQLKVIGSPMRLEDLRQKTAEYLRGNVNDFLPFLTNPDSDDALTEEQYQQYCDNVESTSAWGGAIELQVLSRILSCPIEVVQATGSPYIVGDEFESCKKITLTYHRHMYELGAHYNSVTKFVKDDNEDS